MKTIDSGIPRVVRAIRPSQSAFWSQRTEFHNEIRGSILKVAEWKSNPSLMKTGN